MLKSVNNKQYVSNIIIKQHKVVLILFIIHILIRFKIFVFQIPYRITYLTLNLTLQNNLAIFVVYFQIDYLLYLVAGLPPL